MAIYTRAGDQGMTSLRQGERVSKGSLQVAVLGELDELNCQIGFGVSVIENLVSVYQEMGDKTREDDLGQVVKQLRKVQGELLELGAQVASNKLQITRPSASGRVETYEKKTAGVSDENYVEKANKWLGRVGAMVKSIDDYEQSLPTLENFILPGGGVGGAALHVSRSFLRRVERTMVRLVQSNSGATRQIVPEYALGWLPYLNRLGDWLFVIARYTAWICQEKEHVWQNDK